MRLVGNRPVTPGRGDYLSDHFGVAVQFGLRFGLPADAEAAVAGQESAGQQPVVAASTNAEGEDQQVQLQQQAAAAAALASAPGAEDSRQPAAAAQAAGTTIM